MITLNLIPKEKKAEIGLMNFYITLKNVIILILCITIFIAVSLLITKAALQNYFNTVVAQTTLTNQYASSFSQGVQKFNKKLTAAEKIYSTFTSWTKFLIQFSKLVPSDVVISSINIQGQKVLLSGTAQTRDGLIKFDSNLKQSPLFSNVETPLENLLKRNDVEFNTRADINLQKL